MSTLQKKLSSLYGSTLIGFQLDVPQGQLVSKIKLPRGFSGADHYDLKVMGISACLFYHCGGEQGKEELPTTFYYQPSLQKTFKTRLESMYHKVSLHYNFCIEMKGTEIYIKAKQLYIDHEVWSLS